MSWNDHEYDKKLSIQMKKQTKQVTIEKDYEFTRQQIVSFGNYLLSDLRKVSEINKDKVTHADIENWWHMYNVIN